MATQVKTGLIANDAITDAKIANVALTGVTASGGDSSTALATTAFVATEINSLIDSAPGALNTLNELAAAMGDDANFSTTVTNSIATKLPLAGGTLTGALAINSGAANVGLTITSTDGTGAIKLADNAGNVELSAVGNDLHIQNAGAAAKMVVLNSGNVGIGTVSPSSLLTVHNSSTSGNTQLHIHNNKSGDAAVLKLEGKRTSLNDTGQIIFANNGNNVAKIDARSAADDGALRFFTSASGTGSSLDQKMTIDTSGNVGIGVTPSGWAGGTLGLQIKNSGLYGYAQSGINELGHTTNIYYDGGWKTISNDVGSLFYQSGENGFIFGTTPAASAGTGVSFNESMRLTADGKLGIGTSTGVSTPVSRLNVRAANNHTSGSDREDLVTFHQGISAWQVGRGAGIRWVGDVSRTMAGISSYIFGTEQTGLAFETGGANSTGNLDPTTRMVIDHNGNVGIGTTNPLWTLHIEGDTNSYSTSPLLYFGSTSTANANIRDWAIGPADSNYGDFHIFQGTSTGASAVGSTQVKFTINSSGNVGIGDRTPDSRLTVANTAAGDGSNIADFVGSDANQRLIVSNFTCGSDEDRVGFIWENQGVALWRNWMDDAGNLRLKSSNPTHDHDGKRVVTETLNTGTSGGFLEQSRVYPGNIANYTGDVDGGSNKGGTQIWIFSIQGNNTWYKVLTNMHDMSFEMYTTVGDAGSRDQASYSANMTSPAYGVSSLNQNYYHNGGWNTGSFEYRYVATPGNTAQYDLECRFTSYYSSSNVGTGYIHMRRVY